ncbi:MAG: hypothetical protein ACOX37_11500 [Bacillota bacterium]
MIGIGNMETFFTPRALTTPAMSKASRLLSQGGGPRSRVGLVTGHGRPAVVQNQESEIYA